MKATPKRGTLRTLVVVTVTISERWAIGAVADATATVQLPVMLDRRPGRASTPFVPASGLVGSLRRALPDVEATRLLGPDIGLWEVRRDHSLKDQDARPGTIAFLGTLPVDAELSSRGATRVDPERGAASDNTLREEQWVEPTAVRLALLHDGAVDEPLLDALKAWRPQVGRSRTAGMGWGHVSHLRHVTVDLGDPDQLTWWLDGRRQEWLETGAETPDGIAMSVWAHNAPTRPEDAPAPLADLTVWKLRVAERIHVGAGQQEEVSGSIVGAPLRSGGRLTIPGSSWKGVFRHRAETILNAVFASDKQRDGIVGVLFGTVADTAAAKRGEQARRGRLVFLDSPTAVRQGSPRTHVAIDRFTGGARDSALHTVVAIPEDTPLTLRIGHAGTADSAVRNLLEHIIRDLHEGLATVGRGGTRGYGRVQRDEDAPVLRPVSVRKLLAECGLDEKEERG